MPHRFRIMPDGAFVAGDPATGLTAYAYPTSTYAETAARSDKWAADTAGKMLRGQLTHADRDEYDLRNWWRINTGEEPRDDQPAPVYLPPALARA